MELPKGRWLVGLLLLGIAATAGCGASPSEPLAEDESPILGGDLDTKDTSVFGLIIHQSDSLVACSATLIAPNLLLTARHCVASGVSEEVVCGRSTFGDTYDPSQMYATNAATFDSASNWYPGSEVHVPDEGNDTCGYDVALIVLGRSVPSSVAVPSVPRIDREVNKGESYTSVGYGIADDGHAGTRRLRTGLEISCDPGTCGFDVRSSEFIGDTGVCQGDSGGPAFDVDGKVIGVVSRGAEDCSIPVYGTVTAWRDLLMQTAQHAATLGGYPAPSWATSGSTTGSTAKPPLSSSSSDTPVAIGDSCSASNQCGPGNGCYQPKSGEAFCVALCASNGTCGSGYTCESIQNGATSVCLPGSGSHPSSSGCTVGGAHSSDVPGMVAVAFAAGGLWYGRRRSRNRSTPS
jgi:hypothetical protein